MSENENEAEREVRGLLESQGFCVERISEEPPEKRAGYLVTDDCAKYIIEVKGRERDEDFDQKLLELGEAEREEIAGRTNPVSSCIRDAAQQLEATPAEPNSFQIIALVARGNAPETQYEQFLATLYGTTHLLIPDPDNSVRDVPCFYSLIVNSSLFLELMRH